MKQKEKQQLREMTIDQLQKRAAELRASVASLLLERTSKPVKNVRSAYNQRKSLAVVLSLLVEKQRTQKQSSRKGAAK